MNKLIMFLLCILFGSCVASKPSAEEFYKRSLNLALPNQVQDFKGSGTDSALVFTSEGYFTYRAGREYFDLLENHDKFIEPSEFNSKIHQISCTSSEFPHDFSYWTKQSVSLVNKDCYTGTFFPYVHYIVYDPTIGEINHFVTGMRN